MNPESKRVATASTRQSALHQPISADGQLLNVAPTYDALTAALAERVFGWRTAPDRFLKANRIWIPRWRFQPFSNIEDALALLDAVKPTAYSITSKDGQRVTGTVQHGGRTGRATDMCRATAIATALARLLGLECSTEEPHV